MSCAALFLPQFLRRVVVVLPLLPLLSLAACDGSSGTGPPDDDGPNAAPSVTILAPGDGTTVREGTPVTFQASASDPEDGSLSAAITWTSSLDGGLGSGASLSRSLSEGSHLITARATDSGGRSTSATVAVTVVGNQAPALTITTPSDGTSVTEGTEVTFRADADDLEDGDLSGDVEWTSDLDGALGSGDGVSATLSLGTHAVTATVTDSDGVAGSDEITVEVVADQPPQVSITAPADGTTVAEGSSETFTATASDAEDGDLTASVEWFSDLDGALGTGGSVTATLSAGSHEVTASVTDSQGQTTTASVTVTVDQAPTVAIDAPADGFSETVGTPINFEGIASDPEEGDVSADIEWSSDLDGALGTGASVSATLSEGTHTVTASVTDALGRTVTDGISVTVEAPEGTFLASTLPGAGTPGELYRVEISATGSEQVIGTLEASNGFQPGITDIAQLPNGDWYAVSFTRLWSLDPATGEVTFIGSMTHDEVNALGAAPDGTLYAGTDSGELLIVDPSDASTVRVGFFGGGLASDGDLEFDADDTLWAALKSAGGSVLATVDPSTGVATVVGATGYSAVWALKWDEDRLLGLTYASEASGSLVEFDRTDGSSMAIRSVDLGASGAGVSNR